VYISEISDPAHRGLIGGISGCGISFGTMMSNWVECDCSFASFGAKQWRLALGLQIPFGAILFVGLITFTPDSPRQLVRAGKIESAIQAANAYVSLQILNRSHSLMLTDL
jgi:hypothetical protein